MTLINKKPRKLDPLAIKFKKREGIDKNGKSYFYNGEIQKPGSPVCSFKLSEKAQQLLIKLKEIFPIFLNNEEPLPLMCGVYNIIKKYLSEKDISFTSKDLSSVLKWWTGSMRYKKSIIQSKYRYNLFGVQLTNDIISTEQKKDALQALQFFQQQFEWNRYMDKKTKEKAKKKK